MHLCVLDPGYNDFGVWYEVLYGHVNARLNRSFFMYLGLGE